MTTITLDMNPTVQMTDEEFFQLCQEHRDYRFERSALGELTIMSPTGGETGNRNIKIAAQLEIWNEKYELGVTFDSSTGFKLPGGAERSPDASWVRKERWNALTAEQKEKFVPLCPDFVLELLSPSDSKPKVRAKMLEYTKNKARLGWLIDRKKKQVEIYRSDREVEILKSPNSLSGEDVLPGFVLDLKKIW